MIKRIIVLMLTATLLLTGCTAPGNGDPAETGSPEETQKQEVVKPLDPKAVIEVSVVWGNYLDAAEIKAKTEAWGLHYLKAYCENPTVIGLQRALSAAEAVSATLQVLELPECDLSAETLSSLADSGTDMSFVPIEYDVLKRSIEESEKAWQSTLRSIMTESFWKYGIEYLEGWVDVRLESEELYTAFRGKMSNAVLISLRESKDKSTWSSWEKKAPTILGEGFVWRDDEAVLTEEMSDILDRLEDLTVRAASLNGILSANYGMFETAIEFEDWSEVNSVAVNFADHFVPIPLPEWSITNVYSYKFDDTANDAIWTSVGDDLTVCPDGFIFQYDGISRDEFYSYIDFLSTLGIKHYAAGSTVEDDSISLRYFEPCTMSLKWSNNTASIYFYDNEPLLVPSWYLGYMMVSLLN